MPRWAGNVRPLQRPLRGTLLQVLWSHRGERGCGLMSWALAADVTDSQSDHWGCGLPGPWDRTVPTKWGAGGPQRRGRGLLSAEGDGPFG